MKKSKKFIILIFIILIFSIIFYNKTAKNFKTGNNSSNQEIVNYILNISSYETMIDVEVNSNKNTNKYIIKQKYIKPNILEQEVIEPTNISGLKIIKNDNEIKLENTRLNISKIYNDYEYIAENCLDLSTFIEEYKNQKEQKYEEKNNQLIMEVRDNENNKYTQNKLLYIDKNTMKPVKMEIKDDSKKTTVYILYNEVKINSLDKQNILAFRLYNTKQEI